MIGCGGTTITTINNHEATLQASNVNATVASGELTRVYAEQTSVYDAKLQELTIEQTAVALELTRISGNSAITATQRAYDNIARIESNLADSEIERQDILREKERLNLILKRVQYGIIIVLVIAFVAVLFMIVNKWLSYKPESVTIQQGENIYTVPTYLIPNNVNMATMVKQLADITPVVSLPDHTRGGTNNKPQNKLTIGHVLVAGETGSGKSTALKYVLKDRNNVTILDPHDNNTTWAFGNVIGGGRDFDGIMRYVNWMKDELTRRYQARINHNMDVEDFEPLTVATDEMPAIVGELGKEFGIVWRQWLREGRKVQLYVAVATQSTRVETLGIKGEGDLLDNFTHIIVLGKIAQQHYPELTIEQERPAVLKNVEGTFPITIPLDTHTVMPSPTYANPDNMTPEDKKRIIELDQKGESMRSIERLMFGYTGGNAYRAIKEVLNKTE